MKREFVDLLKALENATVYEYLVGGGEFQVALEALDDKDQEWTDSALSRNPDFAKMLALPTPLRLLALLDLMNQPEARQYEKLFYSRLLSAEDLDEAPCPY